MNIIFDVDGTLMNVDHRRHFVSDGNNDWESFLNPRIMAKDTPNYPIVEIARHLQDVQNEIVVVSARNERHRTVTKNQLAGVGMHPEQLFLRPDGDFRSDKEFKQDVLNSLKENGWEPHLVFDDRNQVVEMWRANGITCVQVADGDF